MRFWKQYSLALLIVFLAITVSVFSQRNETTHVLRGQLIPSSSSRIAAGLYHALYLHENGTVYASGDNSLGQLGNGTTTNSSLFVKVKGVGGAGELSGIAAVYVGRHNSFALGSNGSVYAWGDNSLGQLGNGTTTNSSVPVKVKGVGGAGELSGIGTLSVEYSFVRALGVDGYIYTWGSNGSGQLGNGTTTNSSVPVKVKGVGGTGDLSNIIAISSGSPLTGLGYTLAIGSDTSVYAWGGNSYGQLGNGTTTKSSVPVKVKGLGGAGELTGITAVYTGHGLYSLALASNGTVYAWGQNNFGQLGNGTTANSSVPVQVQGVGGVGELSGITSLNTQGDSFALALGSNGAVYAWGNNMSGQLGNGTIDYSYLPAQVQGVGGAGTLSGIMSIACGYDHVLALGNDRLVYGWGGNAYGELGIGSTSPSYHVVPVKTKDAMGGGDLSNITQISATYEASFMLGSDGSVYAVGRDSYRIPDSLTEHGRLGAGSCFADRSLPMRVFPRCGNGCKDSGEQCDDGNDVDGDGCSVSCVTENGWTCSDTQPSVCQKCGNGKKEGTEICDDANTTANDGCSATCTIESEWTCSDAQPSVCQKCGNGKKEGTEICDDANTTANDGCSATCTVESGWTCTGAQPSVCTSIVSSSAPSSVSFSSSSQSFSFSSSFSFPSSSVSFSSAASQAGLSSSFGIAVCGNRVIESTEECDDGNLISGDGCSTTCQREFGWICEGTPSVCIILCGDGIRAGTEQCDDDNTVSGDGCSRTCQIEQGAFFSASSTYITDISSSASSARCGDGIVEYPEQCDTHYPCPDGGFCTAICTCVPRASSTSSASAQSAAPVSACGNRVLDDREECEVNILCPEPDAVCVNCYCRLPSVQCGNNRLEDGEECERNFPCAGDEICQNCHCLTPAFHMAMKESSSVPVSVPASVSSSSLAPVCGNSILEDNEQCEAHSPCPRPGDQCFNCQCHNPPTSVCGNVLIEVGEQCDDGNTVSGDGCSATCQREIPTMIAAQNICGNGLTEQGEECDDGNLTSDDGCSAVCTLELFLPPVPPPSQPSLSLSLIPDHVPAQSSSSLRTGPTPKKAPSLRTGPTPKKAPSLPAAPVIPQVAPPPAPAPIPSVTPVFTPYPAWQQYTATVLSSSPPAGQTGPASAALMAAGAAVGFAWMKRRKRKNHLSL